MKNKDLLACVEDAPAKVKSANGNWVENPLLLELKKESVLRKVESLVEGYNEKGLFYTSKDIYIYYGKGGVKVEETPKGVRKMLLYLSERHNRRVIISDGVISVGDAVVVSTDGVIDSILITKKQNELANPQIMYPYAVVTIMNQDDVIIAKKFVNVSSLEYNNALSNSGAVKKLYPTMMARKIVMKRALTEVYSLLGIGEIDLDNTIENMNVTDDVPPEIPPEIMPENDFISKEQAETIKNLIDMVESVDIEAVLKYASAESIEEIKMDKYDKIVKALQRKQKCTNSPEQKNYTEDTNS